MVRAHEPLGTEDDARRWLAGIQDDEVVQSLLDEMLSCVERALATEAATTGRPFAEPPQLSQILRARIGFGDGDRVADGRFVDSMEIDARGGTGVPKRYRAGLARPIERIAAIFGGKDEAKACEFMIPRVRADLDGGRLLSSALSAETAIRATVLEMDSMLSTEDHRSDLDLLESMLPDLTEMTDALLADGKVWAGLAESLEEPLAIAERVIRRHRILTQ
mgnify:FL=1